MTALNASRDFSEPDVAALYLRLSKEDIDKIDKGDDSESIKNQRLLLTQEAVKRGFAVGGIYSDEDYSGTDSQRPEFRRLIEDARLKKFNVVICKSQSRFTRDMEVAEKYINRVFPLLGIRFIGVVDHIDTDIKGNKKARQINALINEWYVEDLSENIKSVFRSKMRQGQYLGAFAAYGYKKDENDRHKLAVDEEAAEVVRKIYAYCLEGYGARGICSRLQEEGILTPSAYKRSKGLDFHTPNEGKCGSKGTVWASGTVKRILTNEIYIGTLIQGREKRASYKSKKTVAAPRDEWIVIKDNHQPIISKEDFYKVQEILRLRRNISRGSDKDERFYPLAGVIRCMDCGSAMARSGRKGSEGSGQNYLRCHLAGKTASGECTNHSIKYAALEEKVLEAVREQIDDILDNEEDAGYIRMRITENEKNTVDMAENTLRKLYSEKDRLSRALKKCHIDKYLGNLNDTMFSEVKNDMEKRLREADKGIKMWEDRLRTIKSDGYDPAGDMSKYALPDELTNELVYDLIEYIEVGEKDEDKDQDIVIHWKF